MSELMEERKVRSIVYTRDVVRHRQGADEGGVFTSLEFIAYRSYEYPDTLAEWAEDSGWVKVIGEKDRLVMVPLRNIAAIVEVAEEEE